SPIFLPPSSCRGLGRTILSAGTRQESLSVVLALADLPRRTLHFVTLKFSVTCLAGLEHFGGRLNTTAEFAVGAVLIPAGAEATVLGTQRPKATSWLSNTSPVPNCRCASISRREHLRATRTAVGVRFWKQHVICVTCCWQKGMRFTINSSSAATTV